MSWRTLGDIAARAIGVLVALTFAYYAYSKYAEFQPAHGAYLANVIGLSMVVLQPPIAMCLLVSALGLGHWPSIRWGARALLAVLALLAWRFWSFASWREALTWTGLVAFGLVLHQIAHQYALGWIVETRTGELQKVRGWNRGHAIYLPTTRSQRIIEEYQARRTRRQHLFWLGLIGLPLGYFTFHLAGTTEWGLAIPLGFFAFFALAPLAWNFIAECLYQGGFQLMHGAKVLDPPPEKPGLSQVSRQKAHGDAGLASEEGALDSLNPQRGAGQ